MGVSLVRRFVDGRQHHGLVALLQLGEDLLGFAAGFFAEGGQVAKDLQLRAEVGLDLIDGALQLDETRDAQVTGLHRDEHQVCCYQGIDEQIARVRRGIDDDVGKLFLYSGQRLLQAGLVGHQGG